MKYLIYIVICFPLLVLSQKTISGTIVSDAEKEFIHVFNKTNNKYTITNQQGEFNLPVSINDTIVFSGLQYKVRELVVTKQIINSMIVSVVLEEQVSELDAVYIKPNLSGDLSKDVKRIKTNKVINSKTLNLPNAHVIPLTQAERKLYTAKSSAGGVSIDAIINAISGRTKKLKKNVKFEKKTKQENLVYSDFKEIMLNDFKIPNDKLYHFLYYVSEDKIFVQIVKSNSNIVIYDFLKAKSKTYLALQNKFKKE